MTRKKPYEDGCAAAHALDLIGERWALLVVRELIPGPLRFSDLRAALPGISANILARRLVELEAAGIIRRRRLPPPASVHVYEATGWGQDLRPIIMELGRWAARSPGLSGAHPMSVASLTMSFATMFDAGRAGGLDLRVALDLGERPHQARVAGGRLAISAGAAEDADVRVTGDPTVLAGVVYGGVPLEAAECEGLLVEGDRDALEAFARCFPLPEPWAG